MASLFLYFGQKTVDEFCRLVYNGFTWEAEMFDGSPREK